MSWNLLEEKLSTDYRTVRLDNYGLKQKVIAMVLLKVGFNVYVV